MDDTERCTCDRDTLINDPGMTRPGCPVHDRDDAAVKVAEALWPQRYIGDLTRAEWQQCYAIVDGQS